MNIMINYFGQLKQATGKADETHELTDGISLQDALIQLSGKYGDSFKKIALNEDEAIRPSLMVLINDKPVVKQDTNTLNDGDTLTLLTAIAGG